MDSSIKKESDLPAADPNTPIPLKYEEGNPSTGPGGAEEEIAPLLDRGEPPARIPHTPILFLLSIKLPFASR